MKKLFVVASLGAALVGNYAVAATMTEAECNSAWTTADANNDGTITESEAARYFAAMRVADKPIADGRMTRETFLANCKSGLFVTTKDAGAPLAGANSFTEGQAKDRAIAAGFLNVSGLRKDDNGIWRGTAMDGTKSVNVAVDYKGNVVAN